MIESIVGDLTSLYVLPQLVQLSIDNKAVKSSPTCHETALRRSIPLERHTVISESGYKYLVVTQINTVGLFNLQLKRVLSPTT